jgi:hypothetical protein
MREESKENVGKLLGEITELLPGKINDEIAEEAKVSPDWVSLVRNGRKESAPVQMVIAKKAIEKGNKLAKLGKLLSQALA